MAMTERERIIQYWQLHRAAMDLLERDRYPGRANPLFRKAIALNPKHEDEDARYHLALCLFACNEPEPALEALSALRAINRREMGGHRTARPLIRAG